MLPHLINDDCPICGEQLAESTTFVYCVRLPDGCRYIERKEEYWYAQKEMRRHYIGHYEQEEKHVSHNNT